MEYPRREDLLGYMLGALEPEEHQRIEKFVTEEPGIDEELEQLKSQIQPLSVLEMDRFTAPVGLARRTVESVAQIDPLGPTEHKVVDSRLSNTPDSQLNFAKSWSISDLVLVAVCCGVLAAIIIPTVTHARFESRVMACQNKLRDLGFAMLTYSEITDGNLVPIKNVDKLNVASSYAPTLVDFGLIDDNNVFYCNGIARDRDFNRGIPTLDEVRNATGEELYEMQMRMGGDFGYSLGYVEGKVYRSPRLFNRAKHVIMSDQPSHDLPGRISRNHGGKGQNVLCEDLHIQFIPTCTMTPNGDPIYVNRHGMVAAGVDPGDDVIGRGTDSPFVQSYTP